MPDPYRYRKTLVIHPSNPKTITFEAKAGEKYFLGGAPENPAVERRY
jgi:hypothetical protein